MTTTRRQYIVIRRKSDNALRISPIVGGWKPPANDPEFTWGGPYKSNAAANRALSDKCPKLKSQLYPEG